MVNSSKYAPKKRVKKSRSKKKKDENELFYGMWCKDKYPKKVLNASSIDFYRIKEEIYCPQFTSKKIRVLSIDPGTVNFGIRIEDVTKYGIIPIVYEKYELPKDIGLKYKKLYEYLDDILSLIKECHYICVEKQMDFNRKCTAIYHHCISYFILKLKDSIYQPHILGIDSKLKSNIFGVTPPKELKGDQKKKWVKKWSIKECKILLKERKDYSSLDVLMRSKKKDDFADIVTQLRSIYEILGINVIDFDNIILHKF